MEAGWKAPLTKLTRWTVSIENTGVGRRSWGNHAGMGDFIAECRYVLLNILVDHGVFNKCLCHGVLPGHGIEKVRKRLKHANCAHKVYVHGKVRRDA